jgi:hypothetical protein
MALAWDILKINYIRKEITLLLKINTIDYVLWQVPGFPVPKTLKRVINNMLKDRLRNNILEPC